MIKQYLMIPHLQIQNANAASSPYTVGFPAMTAWLGMTHALQRRIRQRDELQEVGLPRVAVICHAFDLQVFNEKGNFYGSLIGTANPLKKSRKTGEFERPSFVEEARCHLEISLLVELAGMKGSFKESFEETVRRELPRLKAAGGDIVLRHGEQQDWQVVSVDDDDERDVRRVKARLMPGYAIIERQDLLQHESGKDALDSLLNAMQVQYTANRDAEGAFLGWQRSKVAADGWLVPIAVGFRDLSGNLQVKEQRSYEYEHHFVEPLVTVGEFVMPYRCEAIQEMMWEYEYNEAEGLYLCRNMGKQDLRGEE
ncbi:CRISPR-associated protein Csy2 [Selenomonas ruminantium]|uniref:CRISPR-associated protein Csy2 n=2 Tax=Selenomonas ruminantium TaxID=971 RepID=A0A1M6UZB1_SELRU|nr:CRISPR-associated protein Csy2 [Selenomonas ruminantium]